MPLHLQDLVYRVYERGLAREVTAGAMPQHVGVILDGNRRYAAARGADPTSGHEAGAANIDCFLDWCVELGIPYVTLWLLSTENLSRDDVELDGLLRIIAETVERIGLHRGDRHGVRVTAVGALDLLPDDVRLRLKRVEEATAHHERMRVQVAVGYGGRQEITDALRTARPSSRSRRRSARRTSVTTSTRRGSRTPTSSSARPASCACPAS